jgi:hypothetical protein
MKTQRVEEEIDQFLVQKKNIYRRETNDSFAVFDGSPGIKEK